MLPRRQFGAEDNGRKDKDCTHQSQTGDDNEALLHHVLGQAGLNLGAGGCF